jgi:hypothetical protein
LGSLPLDTGQNGGHVVGGAPTILQDVEAELACAVDVGVEHLADELDARRFVWILFLEVHHETEGAIFKGGIRRADDDCIPERQKRLDPDELVLSC